MSLFNAKEAAIYLKIKKADNFRELVNNGEIGFKLVGKTKFYPVMELDRWLNELKYINSTKEEKLGGHTSQYRPKRGIRGLDALRFHKTSEKLSYSAIKR